MIEKIGHHAVSHASVEKANFKKLLNGEKAHIMYTDPPWGDGNMKYWVTINKRHTGANHTPLTYKQLIKVIKDVIVNHVDGYVFLETGNQWLSETVEDLKDVLFNVQHFSLTYKSGSKVLTNPVIIGTTRPDLELPKSISKVEGALDEKSLEIAIPILAKEGAILLDPCCGMGNSARAAIDNGMRFVGNEFNAKRLEKTKYSLRKSVK